MKSDYRQGVLMEKWFKNPNAIVDSITGDIISPQASAILQSILRFTEGMQGREWAQIPHAFFMRKTQAKRRETIAKYLKELTDNGLILTNKSNGKITQYAINWQCKHWHEKADIDTKAAQSVPVRLNRTSTFEPLAPVRLIRTGSLKTSTFEPYTYKDIIKDSNKDITATNKKGVAKSDKPKQVAKKRKHDMPSEFTVTESQQQKCNEYGINSQLLVSEFDDFHGSKGNQFVDWSKAFSTWLNNHIKFEKLKPINQQGNNNANHQSANSSNQQFDTSTTAGYAAKMDADAAAYFARQ